MAPFDELQVLWQNQPAPAARLFDPADITNAFRKFGRRQDMINIAKSVLIFGALVHAAVVLRDRPLMLLSSTLVLLTAALALAAEWRIQRGIARLDFSAPSLHFVRGAILRLQAQRNPYHTREYMILFGAVLVCYNLMTVAVRHKLSMERRIATHGMATAFPFLLYAFGRVVRAKRFNAEYRPLIARLTVLRDTLEERAL
jgi:hypothetical protein